MWYDMRHADFLQRTIENMGRLLNCIIVLWTFGIFVWYIQEEETELRVELKYPKASNKIREEAKQEVINEIMESRFEKYQAKLQKSIKFFPKSYF